VICIRSRNRPRSHPKETDQATSLDVVKAALAHGANPNAALKESAPAVDRWMTRQYLGNGATPFLRAAKTGDAA